MAVYRADQAQVTFMTEAAPGGYIETIPSGATVSGAVGALGADTNAGSSSISVVASSGTFVIGDTIQIGAGTATIENELREIVHITGDGGATFTANLSAPTAFFHTLASPATPVKKATPSAGNLTSTADQYITLIPGAYETVDVPDPEMALEGRWFLGTTARRAFAAVYGGQQTFAGSIGGFALLDGRPLRYSIGQVSTTTDFRRTTASGRDAYRAAIAPVTGQAGAKKGDIYLDLDTIGATVGGSGSDVFDINSYVIIGVGAIDANTGLSTTEVRKHVGATTATVNANAATVRTLQLDYPLQFDHLENEVVTPVMNADDGTTPATTTTVVPYTHKIRETIELPSVTWHVHMLASDENYANAFDRRYYGGKIGSMTISGEEGGMVTASWDSVNFLGFVHNQKTVGPNASYADLSADVTTPFYGQMQSIRTGKVADAFPVTEPYYFSNGEVTMFGQVIARIRSFSLSISNNEEPRYYISKQMGRRRGPTEIREQRREYSLAVTLALPDAGAANVAQRTLFQELLLEGNYGSLTDFIRTGKQGFNVVMTLTRGLVVAGTEDIITISIPDDRLEGGTSSAGTGIHAQGAFVRTAPHNITEDNPFQVEADILFRNLKIDVTDAVHYYP